MSVDRVFVYKNASGDFLELNLDRFVSIIKKCLRFVAFDPCLSDNLFPVAYRWRFKFASWVASIQ